jgi:hypothetical protein
MSKRISVKQFKNARIDTEKMFASLYTFVDKMKSIDLNRQFQEMLKNMNKGLKNEHERYAKIMLAAGFPPVSTLPMNQLIEIVQIERSTGTDDAINKLKIILTQYYNEKKLAEIINRWRGISWLDKRIPILSQAIDAHNKHHYFLSVTAFLPQIEGIFADGTDHIGDMNIRQKVKLLLNSDEEKLFTFDKEIQEFYLNIVLSSFGHNLEIKPFFSRHAILHGGDTEYGTGENSIRCIMLFDYLVRKLDKHRRKEEIIRLREKGTIDLDYEI